MPRARRLADHHDLMHRHLRWKVDAHFNIAQVCSQRWASSTPDAPAIVEHRQGQAPRSYTYGQLQRAADALSLVLEGLGVMPGDRVAIVLPQRFETAVAYMALLQMGAVAMPLSVLLARTRWSTGCKTAGRWRPSPTGRPWRPCKVCAPTAQRCAI